MARPKLTTPNYQLVKRGEWYSIQWWEAGMPKRVPTGTRDRGEAQKALAQFIAGQGTPEPPAQPTIKDILDAYLADRRTVVRHYERLEMAAKPLTRHLGNLEPQHL